MLKKNGIKGCSLVLATVLLLTGCGGNTPAVEKPESTQIGQTDGTEASGEQSVGFASAEEYEAWFQSRPHFDPLTEQWAEREELKDPATYWGVSAYREKLFEKQEGERWIQGSFVCGKDFYCLVDYYIKGEENGQAAENHYYLEHLDGNTYEAELVPCDGMETLPFLEEETNVFVSTADGAGGEIRVLWQCWDEEHVTTHIYAVPLGTDGHYGTPADLYAGVEEAGFLPKEGMMFWGMIYDKRGYYMFLNDRLNEMIILNEQGELKETVSGRGRIALFGKTPEGVCIFTADDGNGVTYFCYGEKGVQNLMKGDEKGSVVDRYLNAYGDVIELRQGDTLVTWSLSSGRNEKNYIGSSSSFQYLRGLLQNDRGEIVCVQDDGSDCRMTVYSPTGAAKKMMLEVKSSGGMGYTEQQAFSGFQQKHPGITFRIEETVWDTREEDWSRLLVELMQGEGPDILILSRPQMESLAEKGVLEDLSGVLPKEVEDTIYSSVWEYGQLDGKQYGIAYSVISQQVFVSDEVWPGDTWTIADVMQLLEKREEAGEPYFGLANGYSREEGMTAREMLRFMLKNVSDSPFLDGKKGTCSFDSPEFIRLLELCKRYGLPEDAQQDMLYANSELQLKPIKEGRILAYDRYNGSWGGGYGGFSLISAALGEEYHPVGYPTDGRNGNVLAIDSVICVNQKAHEKMDVIAEVLAYFYSSDVQMRYGSYNSVRKDLLQEADWEQEKAVYIQVVGFKPDGSTYVEEYLELMEASVPQNPAVWPIERIIEEEVQAFFAGDKSAEAVANIIQSRVALYLAERQ